jgi:hypothetical protein
MPAITVDDVLVLPRLPELNPAGTAFRSVRSLTTAQAGLEREGFPVRRAFAGVLPTEFDPFVHMDHIGEVKGPPENPRAHVLNLRSGKPNPPHAHGNSMTRIRHHPRQYPPQPQRRAGGHVGLRHRLPTQRRRVRARRPA